MPKIHEENLISSLAGKTVTVSEAARLLGVSVSQIQTLVKSELLQELAPGIFYADDIAKLSKTNATKGLSIAQEAAQVNVQLQREVATSISLFRKVASLALTSLVAYAALILAFVFLYGYFPSQVAAWVNQEHPSPVQALLQIPGSVSLGILKYAKPAAYNEVAKVTIVNPNDILSVDHSGAITPTGPLRIPNDSYLQILSANMVKNLNAEFLQSRKPGSNFGDIAVIGNVGAPNNDSVSTAKIVDGAITDVKLADGSVVTAKIGDGQVQNVNLSQITEANKIAGSAVQLSGNGGITNNAGLSLLTTCADDEVLKWNGSSSAWQCATAGLSGGTVTVQEEGTSVVAAATDLNFNGNDFVVTQSSAGVGNVAIDYANANLLRSDHDATITGLWTFPTGTTVGSQTFTTNNILDSGPLTVGTTGAGALTLDSGTTGAINLGTNGNAKTITIGNTTGATRLNLKSGSGGVVLGANTTISGTGSFTTGTGTTTLNSNAVNLAGDSTILDMTGTGALGLNTTTNRAITTGTGLLTVGGAATVNGLFTANSPTFTLAGNSTVLDMTGTGTLGLNTTTNRAITTGTGLFTTGGATTVNGLFTAAGSLMANGNLSTPKGTDYSTTGSQNNVNLGTGSLFRYTGASTATFTGLTGGTDGRIIYLMNSSSSPLTLTNSDSNSAAGNLIVTGTGANMSIGAGTMATLQYDAAVGVWRTIAGPQTVNFSQGGNAFGATASLGTTDTNALNFITSGNTRFTLASGATTLTGNGATAITSNNTLALSSAAGSALTVTSGTTGQLSLDSGGAGSVNLGTGNNAKIVTIGNTSGASALNLNSGSAGITLTGNTVISGASNFSTGTGTTTINSSTVNLANDSTILDMTGTGTLGLNSTSNRAITTGTGLLTIGGAVTANGLATFNGNVVTNGNVTLGDTTSDSLTFNGVVSGLHPLIFDGATSDANHLTLAVTDPTTSRVATIPTLTADDTFVFQSQAQTLTNKTLTGAILNGSLSGTGIDTDTTLAANSDSKLASQKAIKAYVDSKASGQSFRPPVNLIDFIETNPLANVIGKTSYTMDGVAITSGMRVLFGNDSVPALYNDKVFLVGGVGSSITLTLQTDGQAGNGDPTSGDAVFVLQGTTNANKTYVFSSVSHHWEQSNGLTGALIATNNLSDVSSVSTARTNLGLGTGDSPTFAGLTVASGNILQTGTGTVTTGTGLTTVSGNATVVGLLTGQAGQTISGGNINLNNNSNFNVNVATGTSTGSVAVGGGLGTVAIDSTTWDISTLGAASGFTSLSSAAATALTLDSGTTGSLNLGTGANAKTITIGNSSGATTLNLNSGSGGVVIGGNVSISGSHTLATGTGTTTINSPTVTLAANSPVIDMTGTGGLSLNTVTNRAITTGSGLFTMGGGLTVNGALSAVGNLITPKGTDYSTTGSQNNVNLGSGSLFRYTGVSPATFTGLTGGVDGRLIRIMNTSSANLVLTNSDSNSSAANQIVTPTGANITLATGNSIGLQYDAGAAVWRVIDLPTTSSSIAGFAFVQSGNAFGTTATLGTTDANALNLITGGATRFTVAAGTPTLTGNGAMVLTSTNSLAVTSAASSALSLTSGTTGALTLDSGSTGDVNLGNGSGAKNITIGGTGANVISIGNSQTAGSLALGVAMTTGTITVGGSAQTGTLTLGSSSGTNTLNIANGSGATTLNLANVQSAGGVNMGAGMTTGTITIGGTAQTGTLTLGSSSGTNTLNIANGSGATTLNLANVQTAGAVNVGSGMTTGTITIGGTAQTGALTLGSSSGTNTLNIANGSGATTLNLANVQTAGGVNMGAGMTTGTITIGGTGAQTGTITVGGGTGAQIVNLATGGTGVKTVHIADGTAANVITIGTGQQGGSIALGSAMTTGTISIGGTGAQTGNIDIGTGTGTQALNFGSGGTGAKTVTVGSTSSTGATNINSGTGNINFTVGPTSSSGKVQIGNSGTSTPDMLVLDNGTADPTGTNGAMYYNSTLGKFRCYENGGWKDCIAGSINLSQNASYKTSDTATNITSSITTLGTVSVTPSTSTGDVYVTGNAEVSSGNNTDQTLTFSIETGATCSGTTVATRSFTIATNTSTSTNIGSLAISGVVTNPGASSQTYSLCASTPTGSTNVTDWHIEALVVDTATGGSGGGSNPSADSVTDTSVTAPTPGTSPTYGTEVEIMTPTNPTITPDTASSRVLISGAVQYDNPAGGDDTESNIRVRIRRGAGSCAGTQVGPDLIAAATDPLQQLWIPFSVIDSPATTSSQSYTVCASTFDSNGATATNATIPEVMMSIQEVAPSGADLAELYATNDSSLAPADVVTLDSSLTAGVKKSTSPYNSQVLGIVSTKPGLVMGGTSSGEGVKEVPVALAGRVPVNVTSEGGAIHAGDPLTTSSTPGAAMKATKAGVIIGMAINDFDGPGVGQVLAFIKNGSQTGNLANLIPGLNQNSNTQSGNMDNSQQILTAFLNQKDSVGPNPVNLSEIVTDRVAAGLEIITPKVLADQITATSVIKLIDKTGSQNVAITADGNATFSGTLTANKIVANQIEGLEVFTNHLSNLDSQVATVAGVLQQSKLASASSLATPTDFIANYLRDFFKKTVEFFGEVVFHSDTSFIGRATFNSDAGGFAVIKAGSTQVQVNFDQEYSSTPIVVGSPDTAVLYFMSDVTVRGFKINIGQAQTQDTKFFWTATAVKDAKVITSSPSTEPPVVDAPVTASATIQVSPLPQASPLVSPVPLPPISQPLASESAILQASVSGKIQKQ